MRPTIQILEPGQITAILAEAKRIMAETGMEIRGAKMRQRLLDAGLPTDASGRVHFPTEVVDRAIATAPKSFTLFDRDGNPHAEIGGWNVHFIPGSSGLKIMDHRTGETRLATRPTSSNTRASATACRTSPISRPPSPRTLTSSRRFRMPGASTWC